MGDLRFVAPRRERVRVDALERAYVAGMEYIPWLGRSFWADDVIVVRREVSDSGNLYITWNVEGHGEVVLSTTSLMERAKTYNLPLELARGTINRIRNQIAHWEATGFKTPETVRESLRQANAKFVQATTSQHDAVVAADAAEQAIVAALETINLLAAEYAAQVLALRHDQSPKLSTLVGSALGCEPLSSSQAGEFKTAFNAAVLPIVWRDIEQDEGEFQWDRADAQFALCREMGLKICSGPLLRLDQGSLPDWLYLWEDDFDNLHSYAIRFIAEAVKRYRGKVHIWQCAAGMNVSGALNLSEQQRLRMTVDAIETVRRTDAKAPVIITFDQPWAEYLAKQEQDFSPIHFADAIVRAELGVAGLGMEINLGYWPGGTLPREMLEVNRQIDYWSSLGLPLLVMLTIPSSQDPDKLARRTTAAPLASMSPGGLSPRSQQELAERLIPLLVAKQSVYAVLWNQLTDAQPHSFAHGGLFDAEGAAKPVLEVFKSVRRDHLE